MYAKDPYRSLRAEFKTKLVEKANSLMDVIREEGLPRIRKELQDHSLAFAVWQDETKPDGVGCLIVKGESVLKVVAGLEPSFQLDAKCTAIPCVDAEQATALRQTLGDGVLDPKGR